MFKFLFNNDSKAIYNLALPIIGAMISQNIVNMIDTAMVGTIGPVALASVGIASITHWFLMSFFSALGIGVQTVCSRRFGQKKFDEIHQTLGLAVTLCLGIGIIISICTHFLMEPLFSLLTTDKAVRELGSQYLDWRMIGLPFVLINFCFRGLWNALGNSKNYLKVMLTVHATNIFLNWVFIFGNLGAPEMGAVGAGIATAIAAILGSIFHLFIYSKNFKFKSILSFRNNLKFISHNLIRQSLPNGIQQILLSGSFVVFFRLASHIGTPSLAATHILITLVLTCVLISMGFGMASSALVGRTIGENDIKKAKNWGILTGKIGAFYLSIIGLILVSFPVFWLSCFTQDSQVIQIATAPLVLIGLFQIFDCTGIIFTHCLFGVGDNKYVMKISVALQWLIYIPIAAAWVLYFKGNLFDLWLINIIYRMFFALLMGQRFYNERWVENQV